MTSAHKNTNLSRIQQGRIVRYTDVRAAISELLRYAKREYELEHLLVKSTSSTEFGDDRKYGVTASALATICFRLPEARQILEEMLATKARQVALLEERKRKDAAFYKKSV